MMFGLNESTITVSAIAVAAAFLMWGALSSVPRVIRHATRSLRCPVSNERVTQELDEDAWDAIPLDVTRCTAFTTPTAITCDKLCLPVAGKSLH